MPGSKCFSPVDIQPTTGYLDTRSTPDQVPFGGYRWLNNVEVTAKYRMCRARGFRKLQDSIGYNNQDLHDQLFGNVRQPIQYLQEFKSPADFSHFFAGTHSRLYSKIGSTGNWKIISDVLGPSPAPQGCSTTVRWTAGSVGQTVVFSNGVGKPMYHILGQPSNDDDQQSLSVIRDLETLRVTQVGIVVSWNDFIILFNVIQEGQRISDRVIWSDYQRPLSFEEDIGVSLSGSKDLGIGEAILGVAPLNDALMIYTTMGIWEMRAVGGETVFAFSKRYSPSKVGSRCLAYPNTLVSTGDSQFFFARDGIYEFNRYYPTPQLVDWIHRSSSIIFDSIDPEKCSVHHGAYHSDKRQIWWSWCNEGDDCPQQSLVINVEFPFSSYIDHGFTAFCNFAPDTNRSIRDFLLDNCICTSAEMDELEQGFTKEGGYCVARTDPVCPERPQSWYTQQALVDGDIEVEDWTKAGADADSFYAMFGNDTFLDQCGQEWREDECNGQLLFVMASSVDYGLKEYADVYYRERCTSTVGCGTYIKEGYKSLMRSGPMDLKIPDDDKIVNRFAIECYPDEQAVPSKVRLRIGVSAQAMDPNLANSGRRVILWEEQDPKILDFQGEATEAEHRRDNTRPSTPMEWGLYLATRFIYFEVEIYNDAVSPPDTGGGVCFSRFTFDAKAEPRCT